MVRVPEARFGTRSRPGKGDRPNHPKRYQSLACIVDGLMGCLDHQLMQNSLGKRRPNRPAGLMPTGNTTIHAIGGSHGHHVRTAQPGGLRGMWKLGSNGVTVGSPIAWLGIGHTSKKIYMLNGRANQVVRRWSRLGDRNKPVLSRHVRGVRSTTFDIGPMSEVPHMPTSRGQRPAPAYIRLHSSRPTLCARGRVGRAG